MPPLPARLSELAPSTAHRTLAERAFAVLHEAILTGVLTAGERLPIEDLAAVLDMSPMPIREALRRLDAAGLVENIPHRGARVTELSLDDLREVYELRLQLEPLAIRRGAEHFSAEDEAAASDALARHIATFRRGDLRASLAAHTEFHFALYRAGGSNWLERLIVPLWESSERYRLHIPPRYRRRLEERRVEHEEILAACVARDGELAAVLLHNHLVTTANRVADRMGSEDLFEPLPTGAPAGS